MKPRTMTAELEQEIREDIDCNPEYRDLLLRELDAERAVSTELLAAMKAVIEDTLAPVNTRAMQQAETVIANAEGRDA